MKLNNSAASGLAGIETGAGKMLRFLAFWGTVAAILPGLTAPGSASEDIPDQYPQSPLYAKPVEVIPHIWSAIGATARS